MLGIIAGTSTKQKVEGERERENSKLCKGKCLWLFQIKGFTNAMANGGEFDFFVIKVRQGTIL